MKNEMKKNIIVLTLITLVSGLLLGVVFEITKEPIAIAKENAKQASFKEIFPEASEFVADESFEAKTAMDITTEAGLQGVEILEVFKAGEEGYILSILTPNGYAGDISLVMGIDMEGSVTGISFLSIAETAGLGMKAAEPEFEDQFAGQKVEKLEVTKSGAEGEGMIDSISGATITSDAVTECVNAGLAYYHNALGGGQNE